MDASSRVAFIHHEDCLEHDPGRGHPERRERIVAIRRRLEAGGLAARLLDARPGPCPEERLRRVHSARHLETVRRACAAAPAALDPDTRVSAGSWRAALLAAGGALAACDLVARGAATAAFVACRPPGHHAESGRAMGFCLFNNAAVAARYLQEEHGLARVFVVDWDVHHGNGTQEIFEEEDSVFYFSTHQYPFYPGTGAASERGRGRGLGATLNVPMRAGSGDVEYLKVFETVLRPAIDTFRPEAILISAGFDAHRSDPLAAMEVTETGFAAMTRVVRAAAARHCEGRLVSLLEGGYDLEALAASVEAHLLALSEP